MNQTAEKERFRVSVRDLVAAACPPEDLTRSGGSRRRAQEGIREHLRLQSLRPEGWTAEVPVCLVLKKRLGSNLGEKEVCLEIFGRMDGMMETRDTLFIEEIKTCRTDPVQLAKTPDPRHMAQLKCYGYMAGKERAPSRIRLTLTYVLAGTGETGTADLDTSTNALEEFFHALVSDYLSLLSKRSAWQRLRNQSLHPLAFPFPEFRTGQREMAEAVYKIIKHQQLLFARAPTGTGKTMASLFPAVKAMGLGLIDKIFYLTAKTPGQTVAQKAITALSRAGARLKTVVITAKQKICFLPDHPCDMDACPYARAYYTKLARALTRLEHHDHFDRDRIQTLAREIEICPFELSLDLSLNCDIIICDLNYAFDPRVYLKRFFDRNTLNLTFLMDEAHNLPDRLRSMYSADIVLPDIIQTRDLLKESAPGISRGLDDIAEEITNLAQDHFSPETKAAPESWHTDTGFAASDQLPAPLMKALEDFWDRADLWLDSHRKAPERETVLEAFYTVNSFLALAGYFGSHYRLFIRSVSPCDTTVSLACLDPAPIFEGLVKRCSSAVFFSATFFPFAYYQRMLLGDEATPYTISLDSPFPRENLKLIIHRGIQTTYRHRQHYYEAVARAVCRTAEKQQGNYLVFFPSYAYMEAVLNCLDPDDLPFSVLIQTPDMPEAERHDFIRAFAPGAGVMGFAVMGGIFGEGIDLPGEQLIGVMVVGVGLPLVCPEQEQIRSYYDALGQDGFFNAYQMPGFSRVLQAAGRLIRTHEDRGVILLMDQRFARPDYQRLFPREWAGHEQVNGIDDLAKTIEGFWQNTS